MKHTEEPWFSVPYGDGHDTVICEDETGNRRIAFMALPGARDQQERQKNFQEIQANAHRIVACVNACSGIPDPSDLRTQRDELLAALKDARVVVSSIRTFIASEYRDERCEENGEWLAQEAREPHSDLCEMEAKASALIAKIEGEAP